MDQFVRVGLMLGVVGGVSLAVGSGLSSAQHYPRFSEQVVTGQFTVSAILRLVSAILMTWALLAIYLIRPTAPDVLVSSPTAPAW